MQGDVGQMQAPTPSAGGSSQRLRGAVRHLLRSSRRELGVTLRTFAVTWLLLTIVLELWALIDSPYPLPAFAELVFTLAVMFVMCGFYMFWPAIIVALVRAVYRLLGIGAFLPIPVVLLGVAGSFLLFRGWLLRLFVEIFQALPGSCGGHAGGPAAIIALICLLGSTLTTPAALWSLVKFALAFVCVFVLGAAPGLSLWGVLVGRALWKQLRKLSTLETR